MDYKEVLRKFDVIADAKGNNKHPLISKFLQDQDFLKVAIYILDSSKTFKVSKVPKVPKVPAATPRADQELFQMLDQLDSQKGATKVEKETLAAIASESPEKFIIVNKILRSKTDAGFTAKTLEKLAPGLIPYFPYMRCKSISHLKNIKFPCFSQLKADGEYHERTNNTFQTRNGKKLDFAYVTTSAPLEERLMGECLMVDETGIFDMDRRDGNAIINKAQWSGLSKEEAKRVKFVYWDVDSGDSLKSYKDRFAELQDLGVPVIETRIVQNIEEVWEHYDDVRSRDLEGTILKNFDGLWKDGNSSDQIKLKAVKECEVEVFDTVPGKDKNEGMIGSLCCKSSCGMLITDVGMALSNTDRARTDWVGSIITVIFNEISKSKAKETYALSHARLVEERLDRTEADDLEYIKAVKEVKRK